MAYNVVPIEQAAANLPAAMRQRLAQGLATNQNFSEGVRDAFPRLSFKGKVFRVKIGGQETPFIDPNTRQPIAYLDVVLVNASRSLSKSYYIKDYSEGDLNQPDCWSLDAIRPDPTVVNKISPSCITCPMNAFGSRITPDGKGAKACADARRIAVVMPHHLGTQQPLVLLLRVAQSSLKNLKAYAQLLERHQFEPGACITRMAFDYTLAYPKLTFNFVAPLDVAQYDQVTALADGELVDSMLKAPDFDAAVTQQPTQNDTMAGMVQQEGPVLADPTVLQQTAAAAQPQPQAQAKTADAFAGFFGERQQTAPQQAAPVQQQAHVPTTPTGADNIIELPDGKWFNTTTGLYCEAPTQQVLADPDTFALPDGKFFNRRLGVWVTGIEVGAPAVGQPGAAQAQAQPQAQVQPEPAPPATRKRAPAKNKAQQQAGLAQQTTSETQQAQPEAQAQPQAQAQPPLQPNGNGAHVAAAPADLEDMLQRILPAKQ